ncbi:MAG: cob(I)yrinic acid a,c-diamide adenosyltransferase [Candidatus Omnitrophica bacterium]|nr:cob(I)yrinic acid a,c-diamide adenosyltransferase [Candidatus Omnitrophota bacterium]
MIQVYTGKGKGKTTAALGLCLRAAGAGLNVYLCQFIKGKFYNELRALKKFKNIKVEQFGRGCFIKKAPSSKDLALAKKGVDKVRKLLAQNKHNIIILDEINVALDLGLLDLAEVIKVIKSAPKETELVLTGRNAPAGILKIADLISEIKETRHYFKKGVKARKGIEF